MPLFNTWLRFTNQVRQQSPKRVVPAASMCLIAVADRRFADFPSSMLASPV
jgi:hypothetical protein